MKRRVLYERKIIDSNTNHFDFLQVGEPKDYQNTFDNHFDDIPRNVL